MTDDEVDQYFASQELSQITPPSTEELDKLEEAFRGGIITDSTKLTAMRSLALQLASSIDLSETRRSALRQIAFRLLEISLRFSSAITAQDTAQQALDQLAILQSEKRIYGTSYLETEV